VGIMGMTRAVWVGQARVWVGHGLHGLIARTASGTSSLIQVIPSIIWNDVVHKPEVHNVSQKRTEPRPHVTRTENLWKFGHCGF